jgi:tetratricopeptide (TPR) repeat protein
MSSGTLSKSMIEAQQAYLDGNFLEAHSLFLDLEKQTKNRDFPLLNSLCNAYLLVTEYKTGGKPKIIKKHLDALTKFFDDIKNTLESIEIVKEFNFIGSELLSLKRFPEAIVLLKISLRIAKTAKSLVDLRISTYNLGYAYLGNQKPVEGAKLLGIAANLEDDFFEAEQGIKRSIEIYSKAKRMDDASALIDDSLGKWKDNETAVHRIHYLRAELGKKRLAQVVNTNSADHVRVLITEALESCEKAGDGKLLSETLYQAGVALDTLEEPERKVFWKKAREVSLGFSSQDVFIRSSVSLAFLSIDGEKPADAIPLLEDALEIAQDMKNHVMMERINGILSTIDIIMPVPADEEQHQEELALSSNGPAENGMEPLLDSEEAPQEPKSEVGTTKEDDVLPRLPQIPTTPSRFTQIDPEDVAETPPEATPPSTFDDELPDEEPEVPEITRETVGDFLTNEGYSVSYDQQVDRTTVVDIVAIKRKRTRKKRLFVLFSGTPGDAKIGSFLLNRLEKSGKKLIYLSSGSLAEVGRVGKGITVVTDLSELIKP